MSQYEFFTFSEYIRKDQDLLTPSAEDYMEMIYRLSSSNGFTRVNDLASALNVQPSSVSKMIHKLSEMKLVKYEKYGVIMLEASGVEIGKSLLKRHNLIEKFLKFLNVTEGLLLETEKIEHTINEEVLKGIKDLVDFFQDYPDLLERFNAYRKEKNKD
ncbi:transcriptional regulator MntR [Clostridium swellfunianum]|uniref:transcriptional regulator MntR n=1 Tax=Clostridium swellfunianum TaxID=1367462 RepID=UPI00202FBD19|nr:transcriptional regulator MntR [Clostridium swellfunianum]